MLASMLWILAAMGVYGLLHSWLASVRVKTWVSRHLGAAATRSYRLFYNVVSVIALLPVLALLRYLPDRLLYHLPLPWSLLAVGIQLCGVGLAAESVRQTGALAFLGFRPTPAVGSAHFVHTGLYRSVRHPLYSGTLLFLWFNPILTFNLLAFNLAASLYIWIGSRFEEHKLLNEFGAEYTEYRRTTPALIPRCLHR